MALREYNLVLDGFNPRSREGSDQRRVALSRYNLWFQSTLPRGERPSRIRSAGHRDRVSIHAPARGATFYYSPKDYQTMVSIHAPARGATGICLCQMSRNWRFNPRSREGSDQTTVRQRLPSAIVSIHAPARGATSDTRGRHSAQHVSIHAPARGATGCQCRHTDAVICFNPRSREGSDGIFAKYRNGLASFNPRSREGSDPLPA